MENAPSLLRELAHELRDALSPIRSALDLMRLRGYEAQATQALSPRIERGVSGALAILDAFVLAEQYAAGTVSMQCVPLRLGELLGQVQEGLADTVRPRCVFEQADAALQVIADAARSKLALMSMLENAVRLTAPDSSISVHAGAVGDRVQVQVRFTPDPRVGEPAELFESYRSHGSSRTALTSARHILQIQRGDLLRESGPPACSWVAVFRSAAGQTATASQNFAPGATGAGAGGRTEAVDPRGRHVLLVDDSAEVRRAYREALMALGYTVTEASDAEGALQATAGTQPDVALIDIHLPGMNGYQLARRLKARPGKPMPLIMLSGMTLDEITMRESKAAGFDHCFDKAAGPKALHQLLSGLP